MSTIPQTHLEFLKQHHDRFYTDIASGNVEPFVYPWGISGGLLVIVYLLFPHLQSQSLRHARFLIVGIVACFHIWIILHCKGRGTGSGFGIGLLASWSLLWSFVILIVHDAQTDFQRIERLEDCSIEAPSQTEEIEDPVGLDNGLANGSAKESHNWLDKGGTDSSRLRQTALNTHQEQSARKKAGQVRKDRRFAWQRYPISSFRARLDWVWDIFTTYRGMGWNWSIPGLPAPPQWVKADLDRDIGPSTPTSKLATTGRELHVQGTREELLRQKLRQFLLGYLALDVLKVIMMKDPYFWGALDLPPPGHLPQVVRENPSVLKSYRLIMTLFGMYTALQVIFCMGPLLYVGILGPKLVGARGEPWMYPDSYGSFSKVLDKGLAGWWGGWWHQTFRFAFESSSSWIINGLGIKRNTTVARVLQLVVAFFLSGLIHASGSQTQLGKTHPLSGSLLFFCIQPFGILAQSLLAFLLRKAGITPKLPKLVRQISNFIFVHAWFYFTGPLLCDDFAIGGLWLFEPVPVSPLRAMGFGAKGESWWCWNDTAYHWHQGRRFWQTGWSV